MTVVHIGYYYGLNNTGGAAIASTRLHLALLKAGVDSHYVTIHQCEEGPNVHVLPSGIWRMLFFALTKITRCFWRFSPYRASIPLNAIPLYGLEKLLAKLRPDVVHVQWINGDVCSLEQLSGLPYRIVFNLHDLYLLNAIKAYPADDRRFVEGFANENSSWIERWLLARKHRMVKRLAESGRGVSFIGPSEWVCAECRKSIVGRRIDAFAVPNVIDETFRYDSKLVQDTGRFVLLYGAYGGRGNSLKGWGDLVEAIKNFDKRLRNRENDNTTPHELVEVWVFGESAPDEMIGAIKVHFLGSIQDPQKLREVYHASSVFAFPSRQETQGMTKIEAMLCGLPVIAFDRTACAEGVEHRLTGWIASDGDCEGFAEGLVYYFDLYKANRLKESKENISKRALSSFNAATIVEKIKSVYRGSM